MLVGLPYAEAFAWNPLWTEHFAGRCGPPILQPAITIQDVERVRLTAPRYARLGDKDYELAFLLQRYAHVEVPDPQAAGHYLEVKAAKSGGDACPDDAAAASDLRTFRYRDDDGIAATLDCIQLVPSTGEPVTSFEIGESQLTEGTGPELWSIEIRVLVDGQVAAQGVTRYFVVPSLFLAMVDSPAMFATCTNMTWDENLIGIERYLVPRPR